MRQETSPDYPFRYASVESNSSGTRQKAGGSALKDSTRRKVTDAYNSAADRFDDPALGFWERFGQETVRKASLVPGDRVLDIGCGTGASALHAAEIVGPDGRVTGIDIADGLLTLARSKARHRALTNIEFRTLDMSALDYPAESFDAVVCVFAIFFVPDMIEQLGKLWRVVKPGGRITITTWGPNLFEPGNGIFWSTLREMRPELVSEFNPWERITRPEALAALFVDAGLGAPRVFDEKGLQPLESPADWWTIACGTGYRWTLDQLSEREREHMRAENVRRMQQCAATAVVTNTLYAIATK